MACPHKCCHELTTWNGTDYALTIGFTLAIHGHEMPGKATFSIEKVAKWMRIRLRTTSDRTRVREQLDEIVLAAFWRLRAPCPVCAPNEKPRLASILRNDVRKTCKQRGCGPRTGFRIASPALATALLYRWVSVRAPFGPEEAPWDAPEAFRRELTHGAMGGAAAQFLQFSEAHAGHLLSDWLQAQHTRFTDEVIVAASRSWGYPCHGQRERARAYILDLVADEPTPAVNLKPLPLPVLHTFLEVVAWSPLLWMAMAHEFARRPELETPWRIEALVSDGPFHPRRLMAAMHTSKGLYPPYLTISETLWSRTRVQAFLGTDEAPPATETLGELVTLLKSRPPLGRLSPADQRRLKDLSTNLTSKLRDVRPDIWGKLAEIFGRKRVMPVAHDFPTVALDDVCFAAHRVANGRRAAEELAVEVCDAPDEDPGDPDDAEGDSDDSTDGDSL